VWNLAYINSLSLWLDIKNLIQAAVHPAAQGHLLTLRGSQGG
jgi:lipopolysaccharide/colanic/teichoic acid biosynthesis glycosyltransferase